MEGDTRTVVGPVTGTVPGMETGAGPVAGLGSGGRCWGFAWDRRSAAAVIAVTVLYTLFMFYSGRGRGDKQVAVLVGDLREGRGGVSVGYDWEGSLRFQFAGNVTTPSAGHHRNATGSNSSSTSTTTLPTKVDAYTTPAITQAVNGTKVTEKHNISVQYVVVKTKDATAEVKHKATLVPSTIKTSSNTVDNAPPFYTFMNLTALNSTGTYVSPIPEEVYYKKQPEVVNRWTFPALRENRNLCKIAEQKSRIERNAEDLSEDEELIAREELRNMTGSDVMGAMLLSVFVITAPGHGHQRALIRRTWGGLLSSQPGVSMTFVLGVSENAQLQGHVFNESDHHGDLLIFDFIDHYENLTIKSMMLLSWADNFCSNAKYVLKTDDDVIYNVFALLESLQEAEVKGWAAFGYDVGHRGVRRSGAWREPQEQYPYPEYPSYLTGPGYVLTSDAVRRIVATSAYVPLLRLEDVYVTGVVRRIAGLKVTDSQLWVMARAPNKGTDLQFVRGEIVALHHYRNSEAKERLYRFTVKYRKAAVMLKNLILGPDEKKR